MSFDDALFSYLSTYSGLTSIINKKIYPIIIPQKVVLPAITFIKISENQMMSATEGNYGMVNPTYQITCHAKTHSQCRSIATQVKSALTNYSGTMGDTTVQGCFFVNEFESHDNDIDNESYSIAIDFEFYYTN